MSVAHTGKIMSVGAKLKMSKFHKGKVLSKEIKDKISKTVLELWRNPEYLKKIRLANKGKNSGSSSHLWKGGITPINKQIRQSAEYKEWHRKVFERDEWTCKECGVRSCKGKAVILHADHIKPFAFYPELRFDLNNGRTLCIDCHRKTDTYKRRKLIMN